MVGWLKVGHGCLVDGLCYQLCNGSDPFYGHFQGFVHSGFRPFYERVVDHPHPHGHVIGVRDILITFVHHIQKVVFKACVDQGLQRRLVFLRDGKDDFYVLVDGTGERGNDIIEEFA